MKLIAYLIMALATMAGSIAAATAYMVPITAGLPDDAITGITLASPAGVYTVTDESGEKTDEAEALEKRIAEIRAETEALAEEEPEPLIVPEVITVDTPPLPEVDAGATATQRVNERRREAPIAEAGDVLSADMLGLLRDNKVEYVRSTAFAPGIWFRTWPSWVFIGAVVLLITSALMVRTATKAAGRTAPLAGAAQDGGPGAVPQEPADIAELIQKTVESVVADVRTLATEKEQLNMIVERLGEIQRTLVPAFAASRPRIIARSGMGGYAQVMDVFAAAERRINRAWSAAADGAEQEALDSLHSADEVLPALVEKLRSI